MVEEEVVFLGNGISGLVVLVQNIGRILSNVNVSHIKASDIYLIFHSTDDYKII